MIRKIALGFGIAIVFGLVAVMMVTVLPGPLRQTEYMMIGAVSTLVAMLVLFLVLTATTMKTQDLFYRKRNRK